MNTLLKVYVPANPNETKLTYGAHLIWPHVSWDIDCVKQVPVHFSQEKNFTSDRTVDGSHCATETPPPSSALTPTAQPHRILVSWAHVSEGDGACA